MPELPDLIHVARKLGAMLPGRRIQAARTGDPTVLRIMVDAPFPGVLADKRFTGVERRGHFLCFFLEPDDLVLAVNCMLTGRFWLGPARDKRGGKTVALALTLDPGPGEEAPPELRYLDEKRMGKVYVVPRGRLGEVPVLGDLGVEVLSDELTLDRFRALARKRRDQVRQFLMDKRALASIGNAYADEILFAARLHPKTFVNKLSPEEIDRLYGAMRDVLTRAVDEIARRDPDIDDKIRDFLSVRGRDGKPCPTCGTTIRSVRVGDGDACFCPQCQPATRALFVDWGKLR